MTIREERVSQRTLYTIQRISIPYTVISSAARNLFRFPPPSLSLLGEAPSPPFLRYSVSHFSLSGTLPLTANEKDPSASLGMTLRKWRFPNISFIRDVGYLFPPYHHFERRREILLALCSSLPLSRKASNFTLSHIRRYTGVQERSRASVGMTIRKRRFPNISFIRDVGYPSPPYRHFERSEKSSLHSALSCFLRRWIPLPCCRT